VVSFFEERGLSPRQLSFFVIIGLTILHRKNISKVWYGIACIRKNSGRMNHIDSLLHPFDDNQAYLEGGISATLNKIAIRLNPLLWMFGRKKSTNGFDGDIYLTSEEIEEATKEFVNQMV
jgi:hypothetical protein